jgi:hypothetical protein
MLDRQGGRRREPGGVGGSLTWFGQRRAGSLCPLLGSGELEERATALKNLTIFFFENHEKLSHLDVSLAGTVSRGKKEKELTR